MRFRTMMRGVAVAVVATGLLLGCSDDDDGGSDDGDTTEDEGSAISAEQETALRELMAEEGNAEAEIDCVMGKVDEELSGEQVDAILAVEDDATPTEEQIDAVTELFGLAGECGMNPLEGGSTTTAGDGSESSETTATTAE
jgi:hypothetical protein